MENTRLILALDVQSGKEAISLTEKVTDAVDAIKVGYPLVLGSGISIIGKLAESMPVIADFKIADIPNTNRLICETAFDSGAAAVIVHGFTGRDSLDACVDSAGKYDGEIYVVTEMSHPGALDFLAPVSAKIAEYAKDAGAAGVVAPATRPEKVREIRDIIGDLCIISPGVGVQGGSAADAIKAGADYVIVGRSIYQAEDPREAALKIINEIKECL